MGMCYLNRQMPRMTHEYESMHIPHHSRSPNPPTIVLKRSDVIIRIAEAGGAQLKRVMTVGLVAQERGQSRNMSFSLALLSLTALSL